MSQPMLKAVTSLVAGIAGLLPLLAAATSSGCSSTSASFETGCTNYTPDAGAGENVACAIGWSCDSASSLLQMICTQATDPGDYDCTCSNGSTATRSIVVNAFVCSPGGALSTANMGCGFDIQQ